jgi:hypothetical protein
MDFMGREYGQGGADKRTNSDGRRRGFPWVGSAWARLGRPGAASTAAKNIFDRRGQIVFHYRRKNDEYDVHQYEKADASNGSCIHLAALLSSVWLCGFKTLETKHNQFLKTRDCQSIAGFLLNKWAPTGVGAAKTKGKNENDL